MKAVIFCDDAAFGAKARALLRRIGDRSGVNVCWTIEIWPVNALRDATLSERVLLQGVDAHLIVIPGNHARSLFPHLRTWLNRWAELREVEDAAIGILDADADGGLSNEISPDLRALVQTQGLSFINNAVSSGNGAAKRSLLFPLELEHPLPIGLGQLSGTATLDGFRGYGINE